MNCGSLGERQVDAKSKLSKNQVLNFKSKSIRNQVNAKQFYDNPPIPQHEVENIVVISLLISMYESGSVPSILGVTTAYIVFIVTLFVAGLMLCLIAFRLLCNF